MPAKNLAYDKVLFFSQTVDEVMAREKRIYSLVIETKGFLSLFCFLAKKGCENPRLFLLHSLLFSFHQFVRRVSTTR